MENNEFELRIENQRLSQTISLAENQLEQAKLDNENNMEDILEAKREMRENATHSVSGLWSSDGFEALVELSQYYNPIMIKFAEYDTTENRIAILKRLIDSPYFARIDFKFDGEDTFENIYIGRASLMEDESCDMYVYDWRSPIASMFYRFMTGPAFYDAPMGKIEGQINLKRQYEIKKGTLEYFFDADVQIVDEFLRKLLSQNTSSKMKAIVETIQREQDIVIRDMENELLMVQGVAGSGKTSIALHRAAYLMYQGVSSNLAANNIIIISPNTLFEQYISNVLPELGEENVVSVILEEILTTVLQRKSIQTRNQFLERLIAGSSHKTLLKSAMEFKTSPQFVEILNRFIEEIPSKWIEFEDILYKELRIVTAETLKNKILSGRKSTSLGQKLKLLEDFILESLREAAKGNADKPDYAAIKGAIQKFTELDILSLYRKLLDDESYFYHLAEGLEIPDSVGKILEFTRRNINSGAIYYDDAAVLAYLKLKLEETDDYKNIKQVVIDEAQDYYPLHFEIFHLLFKSAKYTILGDINQTLEKQEDLSLYEQISGILNKKKSALVTMDKSFRCTNEILNFSSKFISSAVEVKSFNREGVGPKIYSASHKPELCEMIAKEVASCLSEGYQSVGLICKTEKNASALFDNLRDKIDVQIVRSGSNVDLQGVFIIPVYLSKGLEFDAILICDADSKNYRVEDDKKLLYIGCTRALHRLNLFYEGEISPLL